MSKLDSLKISECPYAFASFAAKHNALVDMLAGMVGENGISVVMAEKNAIIRANIAGGGTLGNVTGTMANVVGSDGRLQNVYAGTAIANAYPTLLITGDYSGGAGDFSSMVPSGFTTHLASGEYFQLLVNLLRMYSPTAEFEVDANGIRFYSSGTLDIATSDLARNMGIKVAAVCDSGSPASIDLIASDPY